FGCSEAARARPPPSNLLLGAVLASLRASLHPCGCSEAARAAACAARWRWSSLRAAALRDALSTLLMIRHILNRRRLNSGNGGLDPLKIGHILSRRGLDAGNYASDPKYIFHEQGHPR